MTIEINSLTSLDDIQAAYDALSLEEETVVTELDEIVTSGASLDQRLVTIANLSPQLDDVHEDCQQLDQLIAYTCGLAEKDLVLIPVNDAPPSTWGLGGTHWSLLSVRAPGCWIMGL